MFCESRKNAGVFVIVLCVVGLIGFVVWQAFKTPATVGDWQTPLAIISTADFDGDLVTIHHVRNFRYRGSEEEQDVLPAYYDRTYDLRKLMRVWYVTEPFKGLDAAAHTFLSFEFSSGEFLAISIESRKLKGQPYDLLLGMLHTYPLMYIAADERDAIFVRANVRKSQVFLYPVKLSKPENGRRLLVDMLQRMDDLAIHPAWYNTIWANCTSVIAYHVHRIFPQRLPFWSWQLVVTGYADDLALKAGLLDTPLPLAEARKKYFITDRSQNVGYVDGYSLLIRQFADR